MTHFLVLDFETTGLKAGFHEPVQVGAVLLDAELCELAAFESLIRPLFPARAEQQALDVNGLTLEQLAEAPGPREVFKRLADLVREHSESPVFAGYNTPFDLGFLQVAEDAFSLHVPRHEKLSCDVLPIARKWLVGMRNHKLVTVAERYGITFKAHDALGDVRATAEIMRRFKVEFPAAFAPYFLAPVATKKASAPVTLDFDRLNAEMGVNKTPAPVNEEPAPVNTKLVESLMHELAELRVVEVDLQAKVDAAVKDLNEAKLLAAARADIADLTGQLQAALKEVTGVQPCSFGKVGYQVRKTITHSPAAVRELAPSLVEFCISESVDKSALEKHAKTAIKTGHLPANVLELLEAKAEVKETKAWVCQPAMPEQVLEEVF